MKLGVLFSGGKDSTYAAWLVKKEGHELGCLISIISKNKDSYMFHTPAIEMTKKQAKLIGVPFFIYKTEGEKEKELFDLKEAIQIAIKKYAIEGIVTGALASVYQASRIKKICDDLGIGCINPLWQKNQIEYLEELVRDKFDILISAVAAYPLGKEWVGRRINKKFIQEVSLLQKKYGINPAGEGGEFESLVVNCPLFKKKLNVKLKNVVGENNSWRGEFE
jgi:asparagine synthase (glutamine-hydrolysing)